MMGGGNDVKPLQPKVTIVVDLSDSFDESCKEKRDTVLSSKPKLTNPYDKKRKHSKKEPLISKKTCSNKTKPTPKSVPLQAGVVVYEDTKEQEENDYYSKFLEEQKARKSQGKPSLLFHDPDFETIPSSIEGKNKKSSVTCRCRGSQIAKICYRKSDGKPYYCCAQSRKCNFFKWAFSAEKLHWYRFGDHNAHAIVADQFSADDLCQGRVGDCWFLSALAVVAERPDLILRLFGDGRFCMSGYGIVRVQLFLDGYWKTITIDSFLPCIIDESSEKDLQQALRRSLKESLPLNRTGRSQMLKSKEDKNPASSSHDPFAIADKCRDILRNTHDFLCQDQAVKHGTTKPNRNEAPIILQRPVTSQDLAYSKAKKNQLWGPFVEKAYAKSHGCYQSISGGHIAEAFLDLTGAPTLSFIFDSTDFQPKQFWYTLLHYREQKLPMGCGTCSSAAGIVGMHAYSILDVKEVKKVSYSFFHETGVGHGNVSGFTEYDGTVRLLRVRNPHGKGEWNGDFSDKSKVWEKLLQHREQEIGSPGLTRTMKNDGTFWIDYDNFLMAFTNVDVVLAFLGNHAKSFTSNFPEKKTNHRCARAFQISLLDNEQAGAAYKDTVELYIMGIQKTRRGATHGRSDRKKSYKPCDMGILVAGIDDDNMTFDYVRGEMLGFKKNGHYRLLLDSKRIKRLTIMPISFGHPAATDKECSFVLRFVSDAPVFIKELSQVPRMDMVLQRFCLFRNEPGAKQCVQSIIFQTSFFALFQISCLRNGGDTIFLYLYVKEETLFKNDLSESGISFSVEATGRGVSCRTENGLIQHETISKGKRFEASWRKFTINFTGENRSRLLLVLFRSGQDFEFGSIQCQGFQKSNHTRQAKISSTFQKLHSRDNSGDDYKARGIFNVVRGADSANFTSGLDVSASAGLKKYEEEHSDEGLKQALEISQRDLELEQVLEISKLETTGFGGSSEFSADLERAIQLSKLMENNEDLIHQVENSESSRIELALRPGGNSTVDLTLETTIHENSGCAAYSIGTTTTHSKLDQTERPVEHNKRLLAAEAATKRMKRNKENKT